MYLCKKMKDLSYKVWDGYNQQIRTDSSTTGTITRNVGADLKRNGQGIIETKILAPNNFAHKAGDGVATRKRVEKDLVPALQANEGHTQRSYVKEGGDAMNNEGTEIRIRKLTPLEL